MSHVLLQVLLLTEVKVGASSTRGRLLIKHVKTNLQKKYYRCFYRDRKSVLIMVLSFSTRGPIKGGKSEESLSCLTENTLSD